MARSAGYPPAYSLRVQSSVAALGTWAPLNLVHRMGYDPISPASTRIPIGHLGVGRWVPGAARHPAAQRLVASPEAERCIDDWWRKLDSIPKKRALTNDA